MKMQTPRQFFARLAARRFSRLLQASGAGAFATLTLFGATPGASAADISKANNNTNLSLAGSYTGGVLPTAADRISFDATAATASNLTALTFDATAASNLSILGIVVVAPAGPVTINNQAQNIGGSTFNIGASGIDMSAATQNLTINAGISLSASQAFNVASGRTLTLGSSNAQAGLSLLANTLSVQGAGTTAINELIYGSGGISMTGAGTLTLSSGAGSGNGPNAGNFFSGGISQSAGIVNVSGVNSAGTGAISITGGTMTISQSQFLLTNGATVNGGTLAVNANVGIAGGTVTLTTGTLTSNTANAFQYVTVAANGGTFTPNAAASTIGALSGSDGFTMAAGSLNFGSNNATATFSGNIGGAVASNVLKTGSGTQTLNGTEATTGTLTANGSGGTLEIGGQWSGNGAVAVNAGTLRLNFNSATAPASNILLSTATLNSAATAGGGTLVVVGKDNAASSQTFASTTFNSGTASTFSTTAGAGTGTIALNLGGFSRSTGSAANFILPSGTASATNGILTTSGSAGSLLRNSANAAYGTVGGSAFAAKDASNTYLTALTGTVSAGATSLGTSTQDADIDGVNGNPTVSTGTINTIRFNDATTARTLTISSGQTLTVSSAGILISNAVTSAGSSITGGSLTSGATAVEVVIHQFSAQPFTLNTVLVNNGSATALTKAGPGTLILTQANTISGATYVDSGILRIGAGGSLASSVVNLSTNDPTAVFDVNNQTTSVSGLGGGSSTGGYVTLGSSGTLNITAGSTYSGTLVGGPGSVVNKTGNSTQGFQSSDLAFFGTINVSGTGSGLGLFNSVAANLSNATVNLTTPGFVTTGGGFLTAMSLGNLTGSGSIDGGTTANTAPFTLGVGFLSANGTFSGTIKNGTNATPNVVTFAKYGSGTETLSGNNTYTGNTNIFSGGVVFDYSTGGAAPLSVSGTSQLVIAGGVATFRGASTGAATAITTSPYTNSGGQLERLTLDNNGNANGVAVTLKTTTINGVATLGTNSSSNIVLFDTSSSAANVLKTDVAIGAAGFTAADTIGIRTYNGLLVSGNTNNTSYRADVLLRDSSGIGFATTSGTSIIRNTTFTSLNGNTGGTLAEDGTANYLLTQNLTRTIPAFLYNTLTLDTSSNPVTLIANNIDTFTRFGAGSGSTSGRGVIAVGSNGATITDQGGSNQPTYFYNYQTGTTAGQTLTLNMGLFGTSLFNGTGLTIATDKVNSSDVYIQSGVVRETLAQSSGDALTGGAGVVRLTGGVLEIGAHLTGTTSATSTADFSRSVGSTAGQVQLVGDTGFSAFGGNRTVNLGGSTTPTLLVWGNDNFLVSPAGNNIEGNQTFRLSSAFSDSTLEFQNPIALGSLTRNVDVSDGTAAVDARLSGVLSGVAPLTLVTANGAPAITNAAAGLTKLGAGTLELSAANTFTGRTTISAGTLLVTGSLAFSNSTSVASGSTLQVGNGGATGSLSANGPITDNGTVTFNRTGTLVQGTDFGVISGTGAVNQSGAGGTTILTAANTYTGTTTISASTLQIGNGGTTGSLSVTSPIVNNGMLVFNRSNTITQGTDFNATISGTGAVIQSGAGTTVLNGANTYASTTSVNAGTLLINNTTGSGTGTGTVGVNNTGTLGGNGVISGAVTVNAGGTITGGTAGTVGTLTLGGLTFNSSGSLATYLVDIGSGTNNSDQLTINGTLELGGSFDQITFSGTADGTSSYVLATYTGLGAAGTQVFDTTNNLPAGYSLQYNPTELDLVPVPEPATYLGGFLLVGAAAWSQRKRFRAAKAA